MQCKVLAQRGLFQVIHGGHTAWWWLINGQAGRPHRQSLATSVTCPKAVLRNEQCTEKPLDWKAQCSNTPQNKRNHVHEEFITGATLWRNFVWIVPSQQSQEKSIPKSSFLCLPRRWVALPSASQQPAAAILSSIAALRSLLFTRTEKVTSNSNLSNYPNNNHNIRVPTSSKHLKETKQVNNDMGEWEHPQCYAHLHYLWVSSTSVQQYYSS